MARLALPIGILAVLAAAVAAYFAGFATPGNHGGNNTQAELKEAPGFALRDAGGKIHRLSDHKGKVVLVHFWASWCPPCLGEIPQWVELGTEFKGRPLQLIGITLDEKWEDAHKILPSATLPPNVLSLLDEGGKVSDLYGSFQFPESYLINAEQKIVGKWVGPQEWKGSRMIALIEGLVKKAETGPGQPRS